MALLQPKLSLKVAQRQILTPGLMQMVSVLALNKLELKEMINAEITENPILEEIEENVPLLDDEDVFALRQEDLVPGAADWRVSATTNPNEASRIEMKAITSTAMLLTFYTSSE